MTKKIKTYMGHPIIHQNRRVVIMEVKDDDSFSLGHQLVLWDKQTDLPPQTREYPVLVTSSEDQATCNQTPTPC